MGRWYTIRMQHRINTVWEKCIVSHSETRLPIHVTIFSQLFSINLFVWCSELRIPPKQDVDAFVLILYRKRSNGFRNENLKKCRYNFQSSLIFPLRNRSLDIYPTWWNTSAYLCQLVVEGCVTELVHMLCVVTVLPYLESVETEGLNLWVHKVFS